MTTRDFDSGIWRQHAWRNRLHSLLLLVFMGGFLALLGGLLWGVEGIAVLLAGGLVGMLFHPALSPRLVMRLYGAMPIDLPRLPALLALHSQLSARAGLSVMPELYYIPSRTLNAFSVGTRRQAAIAVTDGLLRRLDLRELAGVLAHEISHVRNHDLWVMGLADMISRATSLLSLLGQILLLINLPLLMFSSVSIPWLAIALLVLAPHVSALAQLALSRTREYDADLNAVRLTGDPVGLSRALAKIERAQAGWWRQLFFPGHGVPEPSLLRTHPTTEDRIARLAAIRGEPGGAGNLPIDGHHDVPAVFGRPVAHPPRWRIHGLWH